MRVVATSKRRGRLGKGCHLAGQNGGQVQPCMSGWPTERPGSRFESLESGVVINNTIDEPCGKGCTAFLVQHGRGAVGNSAPAEARSGLVAGLTGWPRAVIPAQDELSKGAVGRLWSGRDGRGDKAGLADAVVEGGAVGAVHGLSTSPVRAGAFHRAMAVARVEATAFKIIEAETPLAFSLLVTGQLRPAVRSGHAFRKRVADSGNSPASFPEWRWTQAEGEPTAPVVTSRTGRRNWSKALPAVAVVGRGCWEDAHVRYDGSLSGASPFAGRTAHPGGNWGDCRDV